MGNAMRTIFPIRAIGGGLCLVDRDRFTAVLEAWPVNFGLKSARDQERMVAQYAAFLNGLEFPVQVLVHTDHLRVDEYVGELKRREEEVEAHLRPSLAEYLEFVREVAAVRSLLRRRFFLVLSWQGTDSRSRPLRRGEVLWEEAERVLARRQELVDQGLRGLGVRVRRLEGEELFRFLYACLGGGRELPRGVRWAWE
ncbi:MAG: type VI secretion protein [Firmicutes bacterium]|nr:type VI secretion protein [Alicyclobacillaceae bacterium]MCL6497893.1 type VI secretion protein [Bacillota bacterium]